MHACYNSDELKSLVRILNDILSEARRCHPNLSTDEIVQRVFALADRGERDARKLHDAVFGASHPYAATETPTLRDRKFGIAQMRKSVHASAGARRNSIA